MLVVAFGITLYAIVWRNTGHSTGDWALHVPENLLIWCTFIGMGGLVAEQGHVRMDMLVDRLSPFGRRMAATASALIGVAVLGVIAVGAMSMVWQTWRIGQTDEEFFDLPSWLLLSPLPLGLVLTMIHLVAGVVLAWRAGDERTR